MSADTQASWARAGAQLRAACDAFNEAARRWADLGTMLACCQARIGLTPGGIPINWHTEDCPGLEARLAAFDVDPCTATALGVQVGQLPAPLLRCSLDTGHQPPHRTDSGTTFQERDR